MKNYKNNECIYNEIISKASRKKFHIYNSWIIPIFFNKDREKLTYSSYAIVQCYCNKCGLVEHFYLDRHGCYLTSMDNYSCTNCSNSAFFHVDNMDSYLIEYEKQFIESPDFYKAINIKHIPTISEDKIIIQYAVIENIVTIYKENIEVEYYNNLSKQESDEINWYRGNISHIYKLDLFLAENIILQKQFNYIDFLIELKKLLSFKDFILTLLIKYLKQPKIKDFNLLLISDVDKKFDSIDMYVNYMSNNFGIKSIRKYIFNRINSTRLFYYNLDILMLCRVFTDINFINSILNTKDFRVSISHNDRLEFNIKFLNYLKELFTEKQVANIFLFKSNKENKFQDIFKLLDFIDIHSTSENYLYNNFIKTRCTVTTIHDELSRISHMIENDELNTEFKYIEKDLNKEGIIKNLTFVLPKNGVELSNWAKQLNNCMASYVHNIINKDCIIYGVFIDNKLKYAIELNNNEIVQALGKNNEDINHVDIEIIDKWISDCSILKRDIIKL